MKKKIAVVMGGDSHESVISLKSAAVVHKHLDKDKYEPYLVHIDKNRWELVDGDETYPIDKNDFSVDYKGDTLKFDCVFNAIHGTPGEDGKLQGYFDLLNIPYTSAGVLGSSLTFNKAICNQFLRPYSEVNVAPNALVNTGIDYSIQDIVDNVGLPCFVKPNNGGSSFGVSRVTAAEELEPAIAKALEHDTQVIIEKFVKGTEVTCGIFTRNGEIVMLPLTEIVSKSSTGFFDFSAKYEGLSEEITPARVSNELAEKVKATTEFVYKVIGLKGLARIDFIVEDDIPYLIEVNTTPGLSEESIVPQQAREVGISLSELFDTLVQEALK